jgi:hypothetical protein
LHPELPLEPEVRNQPLPLAIRHRSNRGSLIEEVSKLTIHLHIDLHMRPTKHCSKLMLELVMPPREAVVDYLTTHLQRVASGPTARLLLD